MEAKATPKPKEVPTQQEPPKPDETAKQEDKRKPEESPKEKGPAGGREMSAQEQKARLLEAKKARMQYLRQSCG